MRYLSLILILITLPVSAEISIKTCDNLTEYPEIMKQVRYTDNLQTSSLIKIFNNLINSSLVTDNDKLKSYKTTISQIKIDIKKWQEDTITKLQKCEKYWQYNIDNSLGKYYGLIIGINNYQHWPRLTTAINDAKMIDEVLRNKYGFNNEVLINASYQEIITTFKRLKNKLGINDNLLIYYAGRSHREADGQSYWLPSDADKNTQSNWLKTNIITSNLLIYNDSIRNVLIISDSFYSSPFTQYYKKKNWLLKDQQTVKQLLNQLPKYMLTDSKVELLKMAIKRSRILLENNNKKPIIGTNKHSVLAQNLLIALNNREGETIFTARELIADMPQTLEYKLLDSNSKGNFIFKQPHKFIDAHDIIQQKQSLSLTKLAHKEIAKGNTTNGMLFALEALPKYTFAPDRPYNFAAEEKLYEAILKQREYKIITGHEQPIHRVAFSPNGLYIATASVNGQVRLWSADGKLLNVLQTELQDLSCLQTKACSPTIAFTKSQLITGITNNNATQVWDIKTGQLEKILYGHQKGINHITFNPINNQIITVAEDARLWRDGKLLHVFTGHEKPINYANFSPDGKIIATVSGDKTARIWKKGKLLHTLTGHTDNINHVSFSPDSKTIVTVSNDNTARLWQDGESIEVFRGHNDDVLNSAFSPDGRFIITASKDKTANLWEAGKLRNILAGHQQALTFATFSPSGKFIILTSEDHTASLWETETGKRISILAGHKAKVNHAAFSPDSRFVPTVADDGVMRLWKVANGNNFKILAGHKSRVLTADFSADGKQVVTASDDNTARLWDTESGKLLQVLTGHESGVNQALFNGSQIVT
ncbi:MAG: caspase family protein, partial [Proteobacteria bacterium]|nr:caspase family protein [Pseudomonadota bacterium]